MPIAFYMDQHVPRAITLGLRLRGVAGEPVDLMNGIMFLPL